MAFWWVVNKETKKMIHSCDDAGKQLHSIGRDQCWLECPEGIAPGNCKVHVEIIDDVEVLSLINGSTDKTGPVWDALRAERNRRLTECDWTQLPDNRLSNEEKTEWATYRDELRDLPENTEDPANPSWPEQPE